MMQQQREREAWDFALGLIKVDGLEPDAGMKDMIKRNIQGEVSDEEVHAWILKKYSVAREEENS